ncbi:phage terminase small subunit [Sphingomonas psychrotolerans]|uniref:Phage terminase small subunit n=1 Tax=Sphingomonas psychrotolerans TaxID=1327635 RepID=A0ABU3N2Y0_9SPHN|nr:phage terminase small subunit [Sphingomonas psychrotolerans]MDT8758229.1 phage terminase small subunit [Sphingomonas psychrotolerans]
MITPFRRRQQMVRGLMSGAAVRAASIATVAPAAPAADSPAGQEYAALRVLLHDNRRALTDIASHEARNPRKAEFAKAFAPWIEGVLASESGEATQDEILVTNMIWAVDYRDIDYALRLGAYAIRHHLVLPDGYTRSVACFLAEDIAHLALSNAEAVTIDQLLLLRELVSQSDMPDPVMARLGKAIGRAFVAKADAFDPAADNASAGGKAAYQTEALVNFRRALELDKSVGVKKDIERLERQLKEPAAQA